MKNDDAKADAQGRAKLFVGSAAEFVPVLDNFVKPKGGMDGKKLFDTYWNAPLLLVNGKTPKLGYRTTGKYAGEAIWEPDPN